MGAGQRLPNQAHGLRGRRFCKAQAAARYFANAPRLVRFDYKRAAIDARRLADLIEILHGGVLTPKPGAHERKEQQGNH